MFKRLREEWMYWRFRNITRRRQRLVMRFRARRQPSMSGAFRPRTRGAAMSMPTRSGSGSARGLLFAVVVAAILAVINAARAQHGIDLIDIILLGGLTYAYLRYGNG